MEFLCVDCGVQYSTQGALTKHSFVHDQRSFPCENCEKVLLGRKAYNNHKRVHILTSCKICWRQVTLKQIENHELKCSGAKEDTSFQCPLCTYKTSSNSGDHPPLGLLHIHPLEDINTAKCFSTLLLNKHKIYNFCPLLLTFV